MQEQGLKQIGKTRFWLKNEIQKQGYKDFKEIYFASVNYEGKLYIDGKEKNPH
ncbi:MAG: YetF domain-containing protein [Thermoactinomyces sp.]